MPRYPKIPMRPEDVPQQRVHLVVPLSPRPPSFEGRCDFIDPMPDKVQPKGSPRITYYLGTVEWAWSPMHSRRDSYYINPRRSYWLLWTWKQNENDWNLSWKWTLHGYGPKRRGVGAKDAAIYLLLDVWKAQADDNDLEQYHWIDEAGLLSVEEISAIARVVWPDSAQEE